MPETSAVVTLEDVTVAYGGQQALRAVTASFAAGAVGLLGPNAPARARCSRCCSVRGSTRGRMRVLGHDVATAALEIRARVGYMPETDAHIQG